ncbi:hypothetical protein QBZ16_002433 [Prototheca wickerhamii]|uniref:Uncharacterized protein n=1 Tax=Prototheca wickerhamii TaxID=3111 RepID=A0AAD9IPC9_PROWI|nr:hypothetical protein QBZ16_002433 [Prototheca wickerhamii]
MAEESQRREARSLGWLTQSAVQPRKRKEIQGVSATSLLPLRSQLAAEQQKAAAVRSGELDRTELRAQQRKRLGLGNRANAGVAARDARDRASIQTEQSRLADSAAALERKAALYDRLASGQESAPEGQYDVDFELKPAPDSLGQAAGARGGGLVSEDMRAERARQDWEDEVEANRRQELDREDRRHQRREAIAELERETEDARRQDQAAKQALQRVAESRTAALKAAILKKKLAALRSAREAAAASANQIREQAS